MSELAAMALHAQRLLSTDGYGWQNYVKKLTIEDHGKVPCARYIGNPGKELYRALLNSPQDPRKKAFAEMAERRAKGSLHRCMN